MERWRNGFTQTSQVDIWKHWHIHVDTWPHAHGTHPWVSGHEHMVTSLWIDRHGHIDKDLVQTEYGDAHKYTRTGHCLSIFPEATGFQKHSKGLNIQQNQI
jgi:hypothetical protein